MIIPARVNPSPHKMLHPCEFCHGWGSYSALMEHGHGLPLDDDDPRPMYDECPWCYGQKWVEIQERIEGI